MSDKKTNFSNAVLGKALLLEEAVSLAVAAAHVHVNMNGLRTGLIEHWVAFDEGPYAISTHNMF